MTSGRRTALAAALFLGVVGAASPAAAVQPTIEVEIIDETFPDDFLTEECGVAVTTTLTGSITTRTFDEEGTGPLVLTTVNLAATIEAGDNTATLRDVGADLVRRTPDGTVIVSIIGQVPFDFRGVLKFDGETGEPILEPKPSDDLEAVCAALTA